MKFTKRQIEKIAEQTRLFAWAQGAIITSSSGLHFGINIFTVSAVSTIWLGCQIIALILDKRSDK